MYKSNIYNLVFKKLYSDKKLQYEKLLEIYELIFREIYNKSK